MALTLNKNGKCALLKCLAAFLPPSKQFLLTYGAFVCRQYTVSTNKRKAGSIVNVKQPS